MTEAEKGEARRGQSASRKKENGPDPAVYIKRIDAAQTSINRVFIGFVALLAFWLTIELSYSEFRSTLATFTALHQTKSEVLAKISTATTKRNARLAVTVPTQDEVSRSKAPALLEHQMAAPTNPGDSKEQLDTLARAQQVQANGDRKLTALEQRINALKASTLDLSILGTRLPSTITFASQLWLAALALAVLFLLNYRQTMFRNMTLLHGALGDRGDRFGQAGDGSPLLAPLPRGYAVELPSGAVLAERKDLRMLLGWRTRTERYATLLSLLFIAFLLSIAFRVAYIAFATTGSTALAAGFVSPYWRWIAFPLAMLLVSITIFVFAIILFPQAGEPAQSDAERRLAIGIGATAVAVALLGLKLPDWLAENRLSSKAVASGKLQRRPRQRRFFVPAGLAPAGFALARRQGARQLHWIEAGGRVRLWAKPAGTPAFKRVRLIRPVAGPPAASLAGIEVRELALPGSPPIEVAGRVDAFERMALAMIERGDIADAMDCLLLACQLNLRNFGTGLNVRLFDLLRGLIIRFAREPFTKPRVAALTSMLNAMLQSTDFLKGANLAGRKLTRIDRKLIRHRSRIQRIHDDLVLLDQSAMDALSRFKKWRAPQGRLWRLPVVRPPATGSAPILSGLEHVSARIA